MDRPERKVFGGTMVGVGAREPEKPAETKKASGKKPKAKETDGGNAE